MEGVKTLKEIMARRGVSKRATAEALGVNRTTLYRKLAGTGQEFTVEEVRKLISFLSLSRDEVYSIFLS